PNAARPETMQGAEAFARFYFEQLNRAFVEADDAPLNGLSQKQCTTCESLAQGVRDVKGDGHHYGGNLVHVNYASTMEFTNDSRRVLVDLNQRSVPVLDGGGLTVDRTRAAKLAFVVTLEYKTRWVIARLQKAQT
ncbi:MAG: DUF6318 family protein, partial [Terracoccus sp.]